MDNRGWVGVQKFVIFVHVYYLKNVYGGRWVVKNDQNYVHVVIEWPLVQKIYSTSFFKHLVCKLRQGLGTWEAQGQVPA